METWQGTLLIRRGLSPNLSAARGQLGEPFVTMDTRELFWGQGPSSPPLPLRIAPANVTGLLDTQGHIAGSWLGGGLPSTLNVITTTCKLTTEFINQAYDALQEGVLLLPALNFGAGRVYEVMLDGRSMNFGDGWDIINGSIYGYCPPPGALRDHWVEHGVTWTVLWSS